MRNTTARVLGTVGALTLGAAYALAPSSTAHAMPGPTATTVADTVTGCLQKGPKPKVFKLTQKDGKTIDVTSSTVNLGGHVGHTVTLTTSPMGMGKDSTMMVSKMAMVSASCT